MKLYKLTDKNLCTRNGFDWSDLLAKKQKAPELPGGELCTSGVYHAYTSPLVAVFMDPLFGGFDSPARMLVCGGSIHVNDGTKVGCKTLCPLREVHLPRATITNRVAFGVYCGLAVYDNPQWRKWAHGWITRRDRSWMSAWDASSAASADWAAARSAAWAASLAASSGPAGRPRISLATLARKAMKIN